jgi:xylan 1,4-beta-xylosidase
MGISQQLKAVDQGFKIVASFPEWAHTAIVLGESDPEGCAACSAKDNPQNSYRNGELYASYTAEALYNIDALASLEHINFLGAVNWSFEFEDQPLFAGFREMASNGIDKPVLNAFRMLGLLGNRRVKVTSSAALPASTVAVDGVRGKPDINAIGTRKDNEIAVLVWNYHDDDLPAAASPVDLVVEGLPANAARGLSEHFRIDSQHSNAFGAWRAMGSPQQPSAAQVQQLQDAGQLQLLTSPSWLPIESGRVHLQFDLPRQGLSLLRISW